MARFLISLFAALLAAWMLIHCSTSSAPPMRDAGHMVTSLPDGPSAEATCGAVNQSCCSTTGCNAGLTCNPSGAESLTCIPCGANGEPCCVSLDSGADLVGCTGAGLTCQTVISDGGMGATATCVPCGTVGSPCCAGACTTSGACCDQIMSACVGADATCSNGSTCAGGTCAP
jgi:hypothetical protein